MDHAAEVGAGAVVSVGSRTPEGWESRCPLCGAESKLEYSEPAGDATCPRCGCLLWASGEMLARWQEFLGERLGVEPDRIGPGFDFVNDLGADSLDTVELVMELEEEFDISIPDEAAEKIQTVGDAIRYVTELKAARDKAGSSEENPYAAPGARTDSVRGRGSPSDRLTGRVWLGFGLFFGAIGASCVGLFWLRLALGHPFDGITRQFFMLGMYTFGTALVLIWFGRWMGGTRGGG